MASDNFLQLLRRAYDGELIEPLLDYVDQNELTPDERHLLVQWIRFFRGRSSGPPWPPTRANAERNAAFLVNMTLARRRRNEGRKRASSKMVNEAIAQAKAQMARDLGILPDSLSTDNIRRQMKSGRAKMRSARD